MATSNPTDIDLFTRGTTGNDVIIGPGINDYIKGEAGNDKINAGVGNDVVDGGAGNDNLAGGTGDDILIGGAGDDILTGDSGSNVLQGGSGADEFRFTTFNYGGSQDVITDFRLSEHDSLKLLSGVTITNAVIGSSDYTASAAQVDKYGIDQNNSSANDLILTVTSETGASHTITLLDAFAHGETNTAWNAYLHSLGYDGYIA